MEPIEVEVSQKGKAKAHHVWTAIEDEKLVESLVELHHEGTYKADNGFKAGHSMALERMLEIKLPGHGIKSDPHIDSRLRTLKRHFYAIKEMLDESSGFSWDYERNCLEGDAKLYAQWVKGHPQAKGLRNKPFPHYDDLALVFGKDRANGKGAEGLADAIETLNSEEREAASDTHSGSNRVTTIHASSESHQEKRRRRNRSDGWISGLTDIANSIEKHFENVSNQWDKVIECFALEKDEANKRAKLFEEIMKIPDLDPDVGLQAATILVDNPRKIDLFFSLSDAFKGRWIKMLVNQHAK